MKQTQTTIFSRIGEKIRKWDTKFNISTIANSKYFLALTILSVLFLSQIASYIWHRFFSHTNIFSLVRETHRIHHEKKIEDHHHATEDFVLLLTFYSFFTLPLIYMMTQNTLGINTFKPLLITLILTTLASFTYDWYIHRAYHVEDHWLNNFEWFRKDRIIHFEHHKDPAVNFGISSHFSDRAGGTFVSSETLKKRKGIQIDAVKRNRNVLIDPEAIFDKNVELEEFDDPLAYLY